MKYYEQNCIITLDTWEKHMFFMQCGKICNSYRTRQKNDCFLIKIHVYI